MMIKNSGCRFRVLLLLGFITLNLWMINPVSGQDQFKEVTRVLKSKQKVLGGNVCMLIFKDNHLLYEKNLGSYTRDTPELIASCSKWLTAALAATFIDDGTISANDTIGRYLPVFS